MMWEKIRERLGRQSIGPGRPLLRNQKILSGPRTPEKGNEDEDVSRSREEAGGNGPACQPREGCLRTALPCTQVHIWRDGGIPDFGPSESQPLALLPAQ